MNWYKANISLAGGDEETIVMRVLGVSENSALGLLHRWLTYVNAQTADGVTRLLPEDLDRVLRYDGDGSPLMEGNGQPLPHSNAHAYHALNACGWVTLNERGEVCAMDFEKHNSQSAKDRACAAARTAKSKKKKREDEGNGQPLPHSNGQPSPDKRRIYNKENGSTDVEPKERRGARPSGAAEAPAEGGGNEAPGHRLRPADAGEVEAHLSGIAVLKLTPAERQKAALLFFNEMESVGWIDPKGRAIRDWKTSACNFAIRYGENAHTPFRGVQRQQELSRNNMTSNGNGVNNYDIR